jgi:hypothetical protein
VLPPAATAADPVSAEIRHLTAGRCGPSDPGQGTSPRLSHRSGLTNHTDVRIGRQRRDHSAPG